MDEISLVFGGIQTAAIVGGIVLALVELRHLREQRKTELETRQTQLFMVLYDVFRNKEFQKDIATIYNIWDWKDYDDFEEKYGRTTHPNEYSSYTSVTNFLNGLGVLVKIRMIDPSLVKQLMGGMFTRYWEKIEPLTKEIRVRRNWPEFDEAAEYLYSVMKPYYR